MGQEAIIEGLLFKDTINFYYSGPGVGKSVIAVNMLASMSAGLPVFSMFKMKRPVRCSYMQLEGSKEEQLGRLKEMVLEINANFDNIAWHDTPLNVEDKQSLETNVKQFEEFKPEVIFIDSFYCLTSKGLSKEDGFLPVRNMLKSLKDRTQATFIILHHSQKDQCEGGIKVVKEDPFLGSQYLKAFADMMIHFKRAEGEDKVILNVTKGSRNNEGVKKIVVSFNKQTWVVKAIESETHKDAVYLINECIQKRFAKDQIITTLEIEKITGLSKRHIRRVKNDGHFDHFVSFVEEEGKTTVWIKK